jgi:hypothetical protein
VVALAGLRRRPTSPDAARPDAIQTADEPEAVRLEAVRTGVGQRGAIDTEAVQIEASAPI